MGISSYKKIFFLLIALLLQFSSAFAVTSEISKTEQAKVSLIAGNFITPEGQPKQLKAGLHFQLEKEWKVYWRTAGDVGLPITLDWKSSKNVKDIKVLWPAPKRSIDYGEIESIGYKDEVVLPLFVTPVDETQPINLDIKVSYAVCHDICILADAAFKLEIQPSHEDINTDVIIDKFIAKVPVVAGSNGINIESTEYREEDGKEKIVIKVSSENELINPELFVEGPADFRFPQPQINIDETKKSAEFIQPINTLVSEKKFPGGNITVTLVNGDNSVEKNFSLPSKNFQSALFGIEFGQKFLLVSLIAFLGGLILNVMPCVLPVLSIKLLGIVSHTGSELRTIRMGLLASAAGIIVSFQLLAATIIAIKATGMAVGWGFHFQQPIFVITIILILNFFAANLFGLFEINLPSWLGDIIHEKAHPDETSLMGHFLSGALATVLATPCTAPFLGTAVGFALSEGIKEIIWTFFFMSLGLAAPYIIFAGFPEIITRVLPKPGKWMLNVKYLMGFLLILTSLWLIWILFGQLGKLPAVLILLISFSVFVIYKLNGNKKSKKANSAKIIIACMLIVFSFSLPFIFGKQDAEKNIESAEIWQPFDASKIPELVGRGKVVFVDITADWCLTCKANEIFVIKQADVSRELFGPGIIAMRADWTSKDDTITEYLKSHNRYGIPFNVIYGPGAPEGIVLPELLTKTELFKALYKAKGSKN